MKRAVPERTYDADLEVIAWTAKKDLLFLGGSLLWGHFLLCSRERRGSSR